MVKYRGSSHGTNEYPSLIGAGGISVFPVTSMELDYQVSERKVPTGIARLDALLGGEGYYEGSSVLVSGATGTGKTTLASAFASASCRRGERCLYIAFEESVSQILRNMRSVGNDLEPYCRSGLLRFHSASPNSAGVEAHLALIHSLVMAHEPACVIMDPITNLGNAGAMQDVRSALFRLVNFLKKRRITFLATSLTPGGDNEEQSEVGVSSLMDTWLLVRNLESNGERNRGLYILKSRGMAHSKQVREFVLSDRGIELVDVYTGGGSVLTGSARLAQIERDRVEAQSYQRELEARRAQIAHRRSMAAVQVEATQAKLSAADEELKRLETAALLREQDLCRLHTEMAASRMADAEQAKGAASGQD